MRVTETATATPTAAVAGMLTAAQAQAILELLQDQDQQQQNDASEAHCSVRGIEASGAAAKSQATAGCSGLGRNETKAAVAMADGAG